MFATISGVASTVGVGVSGGVVVCSGARVSEGWVNAVLVAGRGVFVFTVLAAGAQAASIKERTKMNIVSLFIIVD
jgi:hypothetical protein